jgi:hypothetical protein
MMGWELLKSIQQFKAVDFWHADIDQKNAIVERSRMNGFQSCLTALKNLDTRVGSNLPDNSLMQEIENFIVINQNKRLRWGHTDFKGSE